MYTVTPNDVITFWTQAGPALWFAVDRDFDARLRWTFFGAHQAAARGDLDDWQATPDGALALILLLANLIVMLSYNRVLEGRYRKSLG